MSPQIISLLTKLSSAEIQNLDATPSIFLPPDKIVLFFVFFFKTGLPLQNMKLFQAMASSSFCQKLAAVIPSSSFFSYIILIIILFG